MTRFARAKGSKSSNERAPEDGTPWEVMKEQLVKAKTESEEAKKRLEVEQQRIDNYEKFLNDRKTQKRQATWCDFPESAQDNKKPKFEEKRSLKKKNKNKNDGNANISANISTPATQKNKSTSEETDKDNPEMKSQEGVKKNEKKKNNKTTHETETDNTSQIYDKSNDKFIDEKIGDQKKLKNKKNKKKKGKVGPSDINTASEDAPQQEGNQTKTPGSDNQIHQQNTPKKKNKKLLDSKPIRRKAEDDRSFQLIVNGKEIELVRFDGFPIMKRDAERIAELRNSMIKKGIPKSEVQRTIKLERRRAEKALARLKKDVCYNCRKGGHNLSDCPELKSKIPGAEGADGVCFKCGSTEHRQFECKVQRDKEFRFASCFICREQGHIARQCPDNPKGLYPNGGSCKLCGDVTHLRKDCPTVHDKREESNVKLNTLDATDDHIEDLGQKSTIATSTDTSTKKPKKIKF